MMVCMRSRESNTDDASYNAASNSRWVQLQLKAAWTVQMSRKDESASGASEMEFWPSLQWTHSATCFAYEPSPSGR